MGHNYVKTETKAPTCTETGMYEHACSRCSYTTYGEIPALGHELEHHEAKDPTCTEIGWNAYDTCTRCDYTTKVEKPALDHNYVKTETKSATCTDTGMYECVCSVCSHETFEEISALGHDKIHHEAKSATCTNIGWSAYDTCTRCEYTTYEEIAAWGHNYFFGRVDDEYHGQVCSRCKNAIDKELHSFKNYKCETCSTWGRGPSGGYVFYDRGEYTGGENSWRYLEAAPADLRLVNGVPTVDSTMDGYSNGTKRFIFGYYRETCDGSNIFLATKTGIGEGFSNTNILVGKMQDSAYIFSYKDRTDTTSDYAASLCEVLEYEVNGEKFGDWFLPSREELNLMYENLHKQGVGSFASYDSSYLSSSENSGDFAEGQGFSSGIQYLVNRSSGHRVRPVRAF